MVEIGSKYKKTKTDLMERIRKSEIEVFKGESIDHMCYFCKRRIFEDMYVLMDRKSINNIEIETKYFLDESCYENSKNVYHWFFL